MLKKISDKKHKFLRKHPISGDYLFEALYQRVREVGK
jgi:hypothetical protein